MIVKMFFHKFLTSQMHQLVTYKPIMALEYEGVSESGTCCWLHILPALMFVVVMAPPALLCMPALGICSSHEWD